MGRRGIRGLKARVGGNAALAEGGGRLNSGCIQAGGVQGGSHSVGR